MFKPELSFLSCFEDPLNDIQRCQNDAIVEARCHDLQAYRRINVQVGFIYSMAQSAPAYNTYGNAHRWW